MKDMRRAWARPSPSPGCAWLAPRAPRYRAECSRQRRGKGGSASHPSNPRAPIQSAGRTRTGPYPGRRMDVAGHEGHALGRVGAGQAE